MEETVINNIENVNPNLCPCTDCFALISKRAAICPKCGAPLIPYNNAAVQNDISGEEQIAVYRPSAWNYFWVILVGIITIPAIFGIVILALVIIEITCTSYELTTHRIIVRRGWISKLQNEIWIKDMRGVNLVQGIWQRIIGVGNVAIGTAATAGAEISIAGVNNPAEVIEKINSLRHS